MHSSGLLFEYVQGMNVIAGMFLYSLDEPLAFACFHTFMLYNCPLYFQPDLQGAHTAVKVN